MQSNDRELHIGRSGLWIPPELREFDSQVVFRTPRSTIQHFGSQPLEGYYGMIDESHFGDDLEDPTNPDLAPDRVSIKPQGEDVLVFEVVTDPDVRCDGGTEQWDPEQDPFACSICGTYLGDIERATAPHDLCWDCSPDGDQGE